jgi:heme/copper-type cytochrome/quinol oxidase subunit 2
MQVGTERLRDTSLLAGEAVLRCSAAQCSQPASQPASRDIVLIIVVIIVIIIIIIVIIAGILNPQQSAG